ncbi:MAG: hypothetical protein HYV65_01825 [Candidatus Spechtbacteria bacterium]|nr:hypothetical protein [Candidatus Spechtbacteria bacterium]
MPTSVSSLGRIHTMSQDIEDSRRKQQGQLKQPLPTGIEPYKKEGVLEQLKKPSAPISQISPAKPSVPIRPAPQRPFMPAPPIPVKPTQNTHQPAPKLDEPKLGEPKLGELALRPQAPTKPATPSTQLPKNFIPVEEEELEQILKERAIPPTVSVAAEKPLPLPTATRPIVTPTPPSALPPPPLRPQPLTAAPPPNLPSIEKETRPIRQIIPSKEGGLKTPEEILGLSSTPMRLQEKPLPQSPQLTMPQRPITAPPLSPTRKFPQTEAQLYEEIPKRRANILQFVAILLGILIVGSGIGGFVYWRVYLQPSAPAAPSAPSTPVAPATPSPFFQTPQQIIELQKGNESFLVEQLRALEHSINSPKTITYLPIKKLTDNSYLQTKELLSLLNVQLPQTLIDSLDPAPMLYIYTPGEEEKNKCTEINNFDISCYSSRLGIIFKILPAHETAVQNTISDQEQNLVQLFMPIILGSPLFDQTTGWKTANYTGFSISYPAGIIVRYNNMPISPTGLNYALVNDYLLIATSKNSAYFALDQLVGK